MLELFGMVNQRSLKLRIRQMYALPVSIREGKTECQAQGKSYLGLLFVVLCR
jgi:hypothetical protein